MTWFPRPTDYIIATALPDGTLNIHAPGHAMPSGFHTLRIRFDSLNPERVSVCKRCANKGET